MKQFFTLKSLFLIALMAVMGGVSPALAQEPVQVFLETFNGNATKTTIANGTYSNELGIKPTTDNPATDLRVAKTGNSSGYTGASGDANVMLNANGKNIIFTFGEKLKNFKSLSLSVGYKKGSKAGNAPQIYLYTSTDGGNTWGDSYTFSELTSSGGVWCHAENISLGDTPNNFAIKFESKGTNDERIDDILITGVPTGETPSTEDATWNAAASYDFIVGDDVLTISDLTNFDKDLTVTSSNEDVAYAEYSKSTNQLTILAGDEGTATISIAGTGSETYNDLNKTISITVNAKSLSDATWTAESSYTLTENEELSITAFTNYDGTISVSSSNEDVVYADYNTTTQSINIFAGSAGTATITVTGTGSETYKNLNKTISITVKPEPVDATWNITDQEVANGASATVESVSNYDGDVTFTYAPEGIAEATYNKANGSITIKGLAEGNTTVTFSGEATENFKAFSGQTFNVTVTHVDLPSVYYQKVTSQEEIKDGETYIAVSKNNNNVSYVMGNEGDARILPLDVNDTKFSEDGNIATILLENSASNSYEITLVKQEGTNIYAMQRADGYIHKLSANTEIDIDTPTGELDNTYKWKLDYNGSEVAMQSQSKTDRYIRYNYGNSLSLFRTYTQTQANSSGIMLYRKVVSAPATEDVKVTAAGYSSHYSDKALVVPENEGIERVYTVKFDETSKTLVASKEYAKGETIAAETGFIVKAADGTYKFEITSEAGEGDANNSLYGDIVDKETSDHGVANPVYYKLAKPAGKNIGFYYGAESGAAFTSKAGFAYLVLSGEQAAGIRGFSFDGEIDYVTGIENIEAAAQSEKVYDLSGRRVQRAQQGGIYIVNGKKIIK